MYSDPSNEFILLPVRLQYVGRSGGGTHKYLYTKIIIQNAIMILYSSDKRADKLHDG